GRPTPVAAPAARSSPSPDGPALGESLIDEAGLGGDQDEAADIAADADAPPVGLSVDAADLELALRYVADYRVLVLAADLDSDALAAVIAAAGWSGAHLIALVGDVASSAALPDSATILERPTADPDGAFATMVAG
ncbi:MAG: hypothetical protein ABIZ72_02685, partial [Candidatus Limnocylindrales bacterium]